MCTAITYNKLGCFAGRNLDVECTYGEEVIITPRKFTLSFRKEENLSIHHSIIGVGITERGYPLYFDAANEHGLYMAGLSFQDNAKYLPPKEDRTNVSPYELIPYILGKFTSVREAMAELGGINITDVPFSREIPLSSLHWIIADKEESVVLEQTGEGIKIHENRIGVLTNNPPFPFHTENLRSYLNLTAKEVTNRFSDNIDLTPYSRGLGALGLPGDSSSASRFIRAAFNLHNLAENEEKAATVYQLFHVLSSVGQIDGTVEIDGKFERTEYSSIVNLDTLTYYYRSYQNSRICAVRLFEEKLDSDTLVQYPLLKKQDILYQNA